MIITTLALLSGLSAAAPANQIPQTLEARGTLAADLASTSDPFSVLKAAFDAAVPARMEDYPRVVDLNPSVAKLRCAAIGTGKVRNPDVLDPNVRIGRYDEIIPGTPDNGPLFPGTPEKTVTKLSVVLTAPSPSYEGTSEEIANAMKRVFISVDTETLPSGELTTTAKAENGTLLTTYRKNGAELFFHEMTLAGSVFDAYGYCYPKQ